MIIKSQKCGLFSHFINTTCSAQFSGTPVPFVSVKRTNIKHTETNSSTDMHQYEDIYIDRDFTNNHIFYLNWIILTNDISDALHIGCMMYKR